VPHSCDTLNGNIVYKHNPFFVENVFGKQDTLPSKKIMYIQYKKHQGRVYYGSLYRFDNDINPVREKADDSKIDTSLFLKTVFTNQNMTLFKPSIYIKGFIIS